MSKPWKWLGSWFLSPGEEDHCASSTTGDGKSRPITWTRTNGSSSSGEICIFEVKARELTGTVSGTVTLKFHDPTSVNPDTLATASLSFSNAINDTGDPAGTKWDVLEPATGTDYAVGGRNFSVLSNGNTISFTLPWGTENVDFSYAFGASSLYAIEGTNDSDGATSYTKDCEFALWTNGNANTLGGLGCSTDKATTQFSGFGTLGTDLGTMTFLHGAPHVYQATNIPGQGFSITPALNLTGSFDTPDPIA